METQDASLPWVESLARIRTLADVAEGLSLVFVFGPGALARQGLKQVSDVVAGKRRVLWHRLDLRGADLSESLATARGEPVVLLVHGMESVEPQRRRDIAITLNTGRNALSAFDALVVFWIPESEREDLFRFCPDLLHWRTLVVMTTAAEVEGFRLTRVATYDVFLSHASADKPAVEVLARHLREDGLEPFLDTWHLVPGEPWQEGLEKALETSRTCAVFVGKELGPWQNEEMRVALEDRVRNASFRVIPVLLPGALAPGREDLPRFLRRLTWVDFRSGLDDEDAYRRLVCGIRGTAPGAVTATLPPYRTKLPPRDFFVHRRELDDLRNLLIGATGSTVGITTALRGAGGFGKTALARALCEEPEVREAFPDGVLWATMGERLRDADRVDRILDLVRWWTDEEPPGFKSARDAGDYLKKILAGQRVLLVVDDVWQAADLEPFRDLGIGTVLATTRNVRALPADVRRVDVDAMEPSEAVALLAHGLPPVDAGRLGALAKRLGEWPLLLRLVKSQLRDLVQRQGLDVLAALERLESRLQKVGVHAFDWRDAAERNEALSLTMKVSLDALSAEDRQRFIDLAAFPEDIDIPIPVIERLWNLEDWEAEDLCHHLEDRSLLLNVNVMQGTIRLHDVIRQYLISENHDLTSLHRRLLARCRPQGGRWTDLEKDETYLWRYLTFHLAGADEQAELRRLLFDLDYLEGKLQVVGVTGLLADYDALVEAGEARKVREALRLSAHVLVRSWGNLLGQVLAGQLLGRLVSVDEAGRQLLKKAADRTLLRPRRVRMSRTSGPLVRTLEGHRQGVLAVAALSARIAVSASYDGTLRVWDLDLGETIQILKGHTEGVNAVAVLEEHRVVSASDDRTLCVWDVNSGERIHVLQGHTMGVNAVAVLDKQYVVSASDDKTLRVWNGNSGEAIRVLEGHAFGVNAVAAFDRRRVISVSYNITLPFGLGVLRVWDAVSGELTLSFEDHALFGVNAIAVLDEQRVISASSDRTLRVWDMRSGKTMHTLAGHGGRVTGVMVLDKHHVVSTSDDKTLRVWHLDSGESTRVLEGHTFGVNAVALLDEHRVISASYDRTLRIWDMRTSETDRAPPCHTQSVRSVAVLDEARVISVSDDRTLRVWAVETGETICTLRGHTAVTAVAVLDQRRVVAAFSDGALLVTDVESGETVRTLESRGTEVLAVTALGEHRVVSASIDGDLRVWDIESCETIRTLQGHTRGVNSVAVLDDCRVVSASDDRTLRVWDVRSGEAVCTLQGHAAGVRAVAVLDGHRVISASTDWTLRTWDIVSGEALRTLKGHTDWVLAVAALNEHHAISVSDDRTLRVWDVESGETTAAFVLDGGVTSVAATADGRMVIAGDEAGGVHFLDLDPL